jgi:hypothetical protein
LGNDIESQSIFKGHLLNTILIPGQEKWKVEIVPGFGFIAAVGGHPTSLKYAPSSTHWTPVEGSDWLAAIVGMAIESSS